jgi:surface protein
LTGNANAFDNLGSGSTISTARYGCCPANKYMSSPFIAFSDASSCSLCPAGTIVSSLTSVPNDEISCELCPLGKSSAAGSTSCTTCPDRKYQDELGYNRTSCTKECSADLYLALDKSACVAYGSDPLPNGNGKYNAAGRAGSLGGIVDDFFQDYRNTRDIVSKPSNALSTAQVIDRYGSIETWDTSQVTSMKHVFYFKSSINPDIRNWRVDKVTNMKSMFDGASIFNRDLSSWVVSSVTDMVTMFELAYAFDQNLCGNTWVDQKASEYYLMFNQAKGSIDSEPCSCSPGKYLQIINTPKTCNICPGRKYQDEVGFKGTSCTKECSAGLYLTLDKSICGAAYGSDPLPDGSGGDSGSGGSATKTDGLKAIVQKWNSGTPEAREDVLLKYGNIAEWDVSEITNMANVFQGMTFTNQWTITINAQDITQIAGVAVTQGASTGTLKTSLTGNGMVSVVVTASTGVTFVTTANLVISEDGTVTYSYVQSDLCGSLSGRREIGTEALCQAATVSLSYGGTRSRSYIPPGCYLDGSNHFFNTLTTSTAKCGTSGRFCLCASDSTATTVLLSDITAVFNVPVSDISKWQTGKVTTMFCMFHTAAFDQNISNWNTSNVLNLNSMFKSNKLFNGDISKWDTSAVTGMDQTFTDSAFNGDISKWQTWNVVRMLRCKFVCFFYVV